MMIEEALHFVDKEPLGAYTGSTRMVEALRTLAAAYRAKCQDLDMTNRDATDEHYEAACWRLAKRLSDEAGCVVWKSEDHDGWVRSIIGCEDSEIPLDCPDDALAALVAACKEVGVKL
jgi:hypothetical protein